MKNLHLIPSGFAQKWLRESLKLGPSLRLSKIIEEKWDWRSSLFAVYAPSGLSRQQLLEFDAGGKVSSLESDQWLMDSTKINYPKGYFYIVENWRARPNSKYLKMDNMPYFVVGDEVYFKFDLKNCQKKEFGKIFTNTVPTFHAYLVKDVADIEVGDCLGEDVLLRIVANVEMIICGVYDGESYMVVKKDWNLCKNQWIPK